MLHGVASGSCPLVHLKGEGIHLRSPAAAERRHPHLKSGASENRGQSTGTQQNGGEKKRVLLPPPNLEEGEENRNGERGGWGSLGASHNNEAPAIEPCVNSKVTEKSLPG